MNRRCRQIRALIGDMIGVLSLFGTGYLVLIIGHGLGW